MNEIDQARQRLLQKRLKDRKYTPGKRSSTFWAIFAGLLAIVFVFALLNRQHIIDQIVVWQFKPSEAVVSLGDRSGMSDKGKFYLYASQTEVNDRSDFNKACGSLQNEKTVVLGCYKGALKRIYVFKVDDPQLDGVEDVTAAHEMLHAVYDRLDSGEKDRIGALLQTERAKITDERLLSLIREYEKSEPGQVVNELHSIFGTELRTMSPELEKYYAQYFSDRQAVVSLKEKYEKVFTDLAARQTELVNNLNSLATEVNRRQLVYQESLRSLNRDIEAFNRWARGSSATRTEYDVRRESLESRIQTLNDERASINSMIDDYNSKKTELDSLNVQAQTLNKHIDSKLETVPSF